MASRVATLVVLLVLAWVLFDFAQGEDDRYEPPTLGGPLFPGLETRDVDFVALSFRTGHVVDFIREPGGPWMINYPTEELAQAEWVERVIENLAIATAIPIEGQAGPIDPAAVGLENTPYSVTIGIGGSRRTVLIGDMEVFGKSIYARLEGSEEIIKTSPALRTMVESFRAEDYVDKHLFRGLRGGIESVRVEGPEGTILDALNEGNQWTIRAPVPGIADTSRVVTLVRGLQFVEQVLVAAVDPDDTILADLGLPNRRQVDAGDWAESLMVRLSSPGEKPARVFLERDWKERADGCYAIRDDLHKLLEIDRNSLNLLTNDGDFFRERRVLPPVRDVATSFRVELGSEELLDIRRDRQARWFFEGPSRLANIEVDTRRVEGRSSLSVFLDQVDHLSVSGFCELPEGEPAATLRIGWNWAGRDRSDKIELFDLNAPLLRARSSFRPNEGLLLSSEILALLRPFVADELRSLQPLQVDEEAWARLEVYMPGGDEPFVVERSTEGPHWEGDDAWGRRYGLGLRMSQSFFGYVWRPETEAAEYPWRVVFLDEAGEQLAEVRLRRTLDAEQREALGVPIDVASVNGVEGAVMLVPDFWLAEIVSLAEAQGRR
ncbi:MAG: hypothetical protein ACI9EF_001935 [Pseudohongiellaceae bacterium]|jgi:hypothetical protein